MKSENDNCAVCKIIATGMVAALILLSICPSVHATSGTWNTSTGGNWTTSANWNISPYPGAISGYANTDTAIFGALGSGTIDLTCTINIKSLLFGDNSGTGNASVFTIGSTSGGLNLTTTDGVSIGVNGGVTADEIINRTVMLSDTNNSTFSFLSNGTGLLTFTSAVIANQASGCASTLTIGGVGDGVIAGILSNAGTAGTTGLNLVKNGSGIWVLSGANTYTGSTTVRGGALVLDYSANNTPIAASAITFVNGNLQVEGKSTGVTTATISNLTLGIAGAGQFKTITLDANGGAGIQLTISTLASYKSGGQSTLFDLSSSSGNSITVSGGLGAGGYNIGTTNGVLGTGDPNYGGRSPNIIVRNSTGYGFGVLSGGTTGTLGRLSSFITLTASAAGSTATNFKLDYAMTTAGTLTRTANLNFNTLTIDSSAGAIELDTGSYSTTTGRAILATGANNVTINGSGTVAAATSYINYLDSTATLAISLSEGSSGIAFNGTGFTNYSGLLSGGATSLLIQGGIVRLSADRSLQSLVQKNIVSGGGVLEIGADLNGTTAGDFSSAIGTANGNIRFIGDSGLSAAGSARVVNFGGSSAQLTWGSSNFLTDVDGATDGGYTLLLSSAKSDSTITIQNSIALGANTNRTVDVDDGLAEIDAILSGALSGTNVTLRKTGAGTLALTATASSYSGVTIVSRGTLIVSGSLSGTTRVSISSNAELNLNGAISTGCTTSISGFLSGSGTTGAISVEGGGTLSPGNGAGTLTTGSATVVGAAYYELDLKKDRTGSAGTTWDKLAINGSLNLSSVGTGQFTLLLQADAGDASTFSPSTSGTWTSFITTTSGVTGFSNLKFTVDASAFCSSTCGAFNVIQNGNNLDLVYTPLPAGAAALGYTKCVINEHPTAADIAPNNANYGNYKWFNGTWWSSTRPLMTQYSTVNGDLAMSYDATVDRGTALIGTPRNLSTGALPLLSGSQGFYIEFDARLSDNDPTHWPALWVMPQEHSGGSGNPIHDIYPGDPAGYERWMELDVDEGGLSQSKGAMCSVISWTGIYSSGYTSNTSNNWSTGIALDRTIKHTFGASYDPVNRQVTSWIDGVKRWQTPVNCSSVPTIAAQQHFYPILSLWRTDTTPHKSYTMYVSGVRAYVPAQ